MFCKIVERAIRLLSYLEKNAILSKSQFVFREMLGTDANLKKKTNY